jgi:hypothetical protein
VRWAVFRWFFNELDDSATDRRSLCVALGQVQPDGG